MDENIENIDMNDLEQDIAKLEGEIDLNLIDMEGMDIKLNEEDDLNEDDDDE